MNWCVNMSDPEKPDPISFEEVDDFNGGPGRSKLKNVTIRGINSSVYDDFSRKMRDLELNLGDAVNKMMEDVLTDFNDAFPDLTARATFGKFHMQKASISHYDKLTITKKDLEEANTRFSFTHIDYLTIATDVTRDVFEKYIRSISHCRRVRIPSILPKLLIYSKMFHIDEVEVYDANSD